MEVIQLSGYTAEEKQHIARRYLVPRQIERNGLKPSRIEIKDEVIRVAIEEYTREAGVRNLERELGSICRKVAREFAEGRAKRKVTVDAAKARELLGKRKFFAETRRRTEEPGVATGLAWTPAGGEVLFVEATDYPGEGKLNITGQLGDVMKESAQAALSFVRAHAGDLRPELPGDFFQKHDLHVHVPSGAIPKDGPSAGVTMATALASLISGRPVRDDTAMTGELTLTGQVLPIGGLKEKALAAQGAGLKRVIAPTRNEQDIDEIPEHLRKDLQLVFVDRIEDVLAEALVPDGAGPDGAKPTRTRATKSTVTTDGRSRKGAASRGGARARKPAKAGRAARGR
jgi:ATP-dependent Lon protease